MATEEALQPAPTAADDRSAYAGVLRFYELAKRAGWPTRASADRCG